MKFRRALKLLGIIIVVMLLTAYAFIRFILLDEQQLKDKLGKSISAHFMRDETEIGSVDVGILNGFVTLQNVRVRQRYDYHGAHPNLLTISELTLSFDRWAFLRSRGRQFRNLNATLVEPTLVVEREKDGACNIDDLKQLIASFNPGRFVDSQTCSVTIKDGALTLIQNGVEFKTLRADKAISAANADETWTDFCRSLAEIQCPCMR